MPNSDLIARSMMFVSLFFAGIGFGYFSTSYDTFPVSTVKTALAQVKELRNSQWQHWAMSLSGRKDPILFPQPDKAAPGLVFLVGLGADQKNFAKVVRRDGSLVHEWAVDWFDVWEDDAEISKHRRPQAQPGALFHGAAVGADGHFTANFEHLSTVRFDACGDLQWKLANRGHHSLEVLETGDILASSEARLAGQSDVTLPNHKLPLHLWTIQRISPDGDILKDISVTDIFEANGLRGLLHMSSLDNAGTEVHGDTLHLNDVEEFPSHLASSVFKPGDLMISLRNINTVLVFDPDTLDIKFRMTGAFLRQHDPDFAPNDKIVLFDNNNLNPDAGTHDSRILEIDVKTSDVRVLHEGVEDTAFYTSIMGKQQLLDNGNLMITESMKGRAFEVTPTGELVWEFNNVIDETANGLVTQATVLDLALNEAFFAAKTRDCN